MVDIISVTAGGELHISHDVGGKLHSQTLRAGGTATRSKDAAEAVLKYIEDNAAKIGENDKLKTAIKKVVDQFETLGMKPEQVARIRDAVHFNPATIRTAEAATVELVKNPLARKMLTNAELHRMRIEDISELDKLIEGKGKLLEAAKDVKANKAQIRALMIEHGNVSPAVASALLDGTKGKLEAISKEVAEDFGDLYGKLTTQAKKVLAAEAKLGAATTDAAQEAAQKALDKAVKEFKALGADSDVKNMAFKHFEKTDPKLFEATKEIHKDIASHMESAVKSSTAAGANKPGFLKRFFTVTEEFKGDQIKAAAGDAEKLAKAQKLKLGDLRKLRVGGAVGAAGLVTYAIVASMGNKGPSENAERVRNQNQGQGASLGA